MNNVTTFATLGPRVETVEFLQAQLSRCAEAAAKDVGITGVQQFFQGYRSDIDALKQAA